MLRVSPDVAVDVADVDLDVPAVGDEVGRAAALLGREVKGEGQLQRGEELDRRFLEQGTKRERCSREGETTSSDIGHPF